MNIRHPCPIGMPKINTQKRQKIRTELSTDVGVSSKALRLRLYPLFLTNSQAFNIHREINHAYSRNGSPGLLKTSNMEFN